MMDYCSAADGEGWRCTRARNHGGDHWATDSDEVGSEAPVGKLYAKWPTETTAPAPSVERVRPFALRVEDEPAVSEDLMIASYARALFETDSRVVEHVSLVADCESPAGFAVQDWGDEGVKISERWERAMTIAWERGATWTNREGSWRREAENRAVRFYDRLLGRP